MSDFVIQFGRNVDPGSIAQRLTDRPGMQLHGTQTFKFSWGELVVQRSTNPGCASYEREGAVFCCAGRPYFLGGDSGNDQDSVLRRVADEWGNRQALYNKLSGLFAIARCNEHGVELMTDPMGMRPVYYGSNQAGRIVGLSTHVDTLAMIAGRESDLDLASLAELIMTHRISPPYTSRQGILELESGAWHRLALNAAGIEQSREILWQPIEDFTSASEPELVDELVEVLRTAGADIARGLDRVAVTLSGGWDSRAMLCALPTLDNVDAITFITRENREVQTARQVAEMMGVRQQLAQRSDEFFVEFVPRSAQLLGVEHRANAHGLCIVDAGLANDYGVIIGGQLSDTFIKGLFMPKWQKDLYQPLTIKQRLKRMARSTRLLPRWRQPAKDWQMRQAMLSVLRPQWYEEYTERQRRHLAQLSEYRPETAEEWIHFWPTSRQLDAGHNLANSRLYASDGLYMHRGVIEFGSRMTPAMRFGGSIAKQAFIRMFGGLNEIPIANTGVAPSKGTKSEQAAQLARRSDAAQLEAFRRLPPSKTPWNDVQNSWVDFGALQTKSQQWEAFRQQMRRSPAMDILRDLTTADPRSVISEYHPECGAMFNLILMQCAMSIDYCLRQDVAA